MDGWKTNVIPFEGGMITNQSPYQQGFNSPGSARILINYEPSVQGGYRRINGYTKAVSTVAPYYSEMYVQGSSQSGTSLTLGGAFVNLTAGDEITIAGVSGTYEVSASTLTADKAEVSLTLGSSLASSPADKAKVTVTSATPNISGIAVFGADVVVASNGGIFKNSGDLTIGSSSTDGWEMVSKPHFGDTVLVSEANATGSTIKIDGCDYRPAEDTVIQFAGVEKTYRIDGVTDEGSGEYTLTIKPDLASSPADNAVVTVVGYKATNGADALDFAKFSTGDIDKLACATGSKYPFVLHSNDEFHVLSETPTDGQNAKFISFNRGTLFLGKDDKVISSAPANEYDFSAANGGGLFTVGAEVTKLISFREQLIIFCNSRISRLSGVSIADFTLAPITRDLGCNDGSSIREVGGDIMFLGPDGLRLLGATDRIGDFALDPVAANIQDAVNNLVTTYSDTKVMSVTVRGKSQYRIYARGNSLINGKGLLGSNLQGGQTWAWAELKNFPVHFADSDIYNTEERIVFTNSTGYVYWMDTGNNFDGSNIVATYATPFIPFDDPEVRKTMYKMFLYVDPEGSVDLTTSMKFDFNDPDVLEPGSKTISLDNTATTPATYDTLTAQYGVARYGGSLRAIFKTQLVGSAFAVSFYFQSDDTNPPYILDTMTVEYALRGRR